MAALFRPWRTTRTWWEFVCLTLNLVVGAITFSLTVTFLSASFGLLITFFLALPFAWLLFVVARGLGSIERSRLAALLDIELPYPHPPLPKTSWFRRLQARATTASRWKEIGYFVALLPFGAFSFALPAAVWSGAAALIALPVYVTFLPGDSAEFGLFDVNTGQGAYLAALVGLFAFTVVAPWTTRGIANVHRAIARALLAPTREQMHAAEVQRLEARRSAAVGTAESERRRIERDLHDGAQVRLVALAMDLGMAEEHFETDPERARELVAGAHKEAKAALVELRDLVRGFHPAILEDRGLDAALSAVVARTPVPVALRVDVRPRPPTAVESAAYFVVVEALANVAKHSGATKASVAIARRGDRLAIDVTDNGSGGADASRGTGIHGLEERVDGLGGWMHVLSPPGGPTTILVEFPCAS